MRNRQSFNETENHMCGRVARPEKNRVATLRRLPASYDFALLVANDDERDELEARSRLSRL